MNYNFSGIEHRNMVISYLMRKLALINIPNKIKAFIIKSMHFQAPLNGLIFISIVKFNIALYTYFLFIIAFILFVYFRGCFLTIIEYKLDKENFMNIADPYLHLYNIEITNDNRYYSILYIAIFYMVFVSWLLLYKYYYHR
uniref:Uncharacterized protein n=1 Tax=viral metagenome TaxID=1070528 RepID=A0A6C0BSI7_9ZZZZ